MRAVVLLLSLSCVLNCSTTEAQATSPRAAQRPWFVLYELVWGASLGGTLSESGEYSPMYLAADLGPMFSRGYHAWGSSVFAGIGPCYTSDCAWRIGLRARYRHWLGSRAAVDLGLGPLAANGRPGVGGLVTLSYGEWLGVALQGEVMGSPGWAETYGSAPARSGLLLGIRFGGKAAAIQSAALVLLGLLFAASWQY